MREIKKNITIAIKVSAAWITVQFLSFMLLGAKRSDFFSFGPSKRLLVPFTQDVVVDNWAAWCYLVLFSVTSTCVLTYNSVMLSPWIESVALNPEVPLPHDKNKTYMLVLLSFLMQTINAVITVASNSTQFDVAVISTMVGLVVYTLCSRAIIFDETRNSLNNESNMQLISRDNESVDL
jgi:hypothetical protein